MVDDVVRGVVDAGVNSVHGEDEKEKRERLRDGRETRRRERSEEELRRGEALGFGVEIELRGE